MRQNSLTFHIEGTSPLHTSHPFSKLTYLLLTGVAVYCAPGGWIPDALLFAINLLVAMAFGIFPSLWKGVWRVLLPLALFMLPIHGLLYSDNQTPLFTYHAITLYQEGLLFAVTVLFQLGAILSASLFFVLSTHPADFITSLTQAGLPPVAAYLFGGPLLMLPAMRERIRVIQAAQRSRGLDTDGSIRKRILSIAPLVSPLVLGAFGEIEQRAVALELQGFGSKGPKTSLRVVADSALQRVCRWIMLLLCVVLISAKLSGMV